MPFIYIIVVYFTNTQWQMIRVFISFFHIFIFHYFIDFFSVDDGVIYIRLPIQILSFKWAFSIKLYRKFHVQCYYNKIQVEWMKKKNLKIIRLMRMERLSWRINSFHKSKIFQINIFEKISEISFNHRLVMWFLWNTQGSVVFSTNELLSIQNFVC